MEMAGPIQRLIATCVVVRCLRAVHTFILKIYVMTAEVTTIGRARPGIVIINSHPVP
jgi:hypothetical protein